jgi:predicted RNA methylase
MRNGNEIVRRKIFTGHDVYSTPEDCTEAFVRSFFASEEIRASTEILEPACGSGRLAKVLVKLGYKNVYGVDIRTDNIWENGKGGIDFLKLDPEKVTKRFGVVITNPPYKEKGADLFLAKSKKFSTKYICFFLPLGYQCAQYRYDGFTKIPKSDNHWGRPYMIYSCSTRPQLWPDGTPKPAGGTKDYNWFVWKRGYTGDTLHRWVKW